MLFVLILLTTLGSVLITWLLPMAFKSPPPFGLAIDIAAGTVAAIAWALLAHQVVAPFIGLKGAMALVLSAGDAIGLAAVMLWVLRRIKS